MQEDFFDESASAEIETSGGSPAVASVSWKAGKHSITSLPKDIADQVRTANEGLAGFAQYNKDANPQNTLIDGFTFAIIGNFTIVTGFSQDNGNSVSYFSNYAKDARTEPLTVWEKISGQKAKVVTRGLASALFSKKNNIDLLPKGAKISNSLFVYDLKEKRIVEIKTTSLLSGAICDAISAKKNNQKVAIWNITPSQSNFWCFKNTGKAVIEHASKEWMFVPTFACGAATKQEVIDELNWAYNSVEKWHKGQLDRQKKYDEEQKERNQATNYSRAEAQQPVQAPPGVPAAIQAIFPEAKYETAPPVQSAPPPAPQPLYYEEGGDLPF